jgi:hypothetical protein
MSSTKSKSKGGGGGGKKAAAASRTKSTDDEDPSAAEAEDGGDMMDVDAGAGAGARGGAAAADEDDGDDLGAAEERAKAEELDRKSRKLKSDRALKAEAKWAARSTKRRASDMLRELEEEDDDLFDSVTEADYQRIVQGRREDVNFIENDGVAGYDDDGEEIFDETQIKKKQKIAKEQGNQQTARCSHSRGVCGVCACAIRSI